MEDSSKSVSKTLKEVDEMVRFAQKAASKKNLEHLSKSDDRASLIFQTIVNSKEPLSDDDIMSITQMDPRAHQRALSELKTFLLNALLELDLTRGNISEIAKRLYQLDFSMIQCRILDWFHLGFSAYTEARIAYDLALELEDWRAALVLMPPILSWTSLSGERMEYELLKSERVRLKALQDALDDAEETWDEAMLVFTKSGSEHPELRPFIDAAIAKLEPIVREHGTFKLQESLIMLRRLALQVVMDYRESIRICDEMNTLLDAYPLFSRRGLRSGNATPRLLGLIKLRRYDEAETVINESEDLYDAGGQSWFTFYYWRFMLYMQTNRYEDGYTLVQEMIGSKHFATQTVAEKDRWNLNRLFAEFFTGRKLSVGLDFRGTKPGSVTKSLLDHFPSFKNDYSGYYVSAIVLEVLAGLEAHHGRMYLIDRIESLLKFRQRNLKADHASQSASFIEMLRIAIKHDFKRSTFQREAEPLFLQMISITTEDAAEKNLVLPYEQLYHALVARLPEEAWLD